MPDGSGCVVLTYGEQGTDLWLIQVLMLRTTNNAFAVNKDNVNIKNSILINNEVFSNKLDWIVGSLNQIALFKSSKFKLSRNCIMVS